MEMGGKHFRQIPPRKGRARLLAGALVLALLAPVFQMIFAHAASAPEEPSGGLCAHHPVHTEACGWQETEAGTLCTHIHDETCGWSAGTEEVPCDMNCAMDDWQESPELSEEAAGAEEEPQELQDIQESQEGPTVHQPGCAYTPAAEGTPCTHVHDESCGTASTEPCQYVCGLCVTGWQWEDGEGLLEWNTDAKLWGLGIPGASPEMPVTREMLAALLPGSITAQTPAGTASVALSWDLSPLPEEGACTGSYWPSAALAGDYALTPEAPALTVLVELGDGETLAENMKFLNQWSFITPDGKKMTYDENYHFNVDVAFSDLANLSREEVIARLKSQTLPPQIRGWVYASDPNKVFENLNFSFENDEPDDDEKDPKYETGKPGQVTGAGYKWGRINIEWDETSFPSTFEDGKTYSIRAKMPTKTQGGDIYNIYVNSNNPEDYKLGGLGGDTRTNPNILTLYVTIRNINLSEHTVHPASPENVKVNLFDYWVKTEKPTVDTNGDILDKSDNHFHEEGGEGVLGTIPTVYSTKDDWYQGINQGHLLLFGDGLIHAGLWNKGAGENCRYGKNYAGMEDIVKNTLTNGWPELNLALADKILEGDGSKDYTWIKDYKLTGDHIDEQKTVDGRTGYTYDSTDIQNLSKTLIAAWDGNIETDTESLQYLFDPDTNHRYKTTYTNVTGLFQLDDQGYYYYNMRQNFAEFQQTGTGEDGHYTGQFILYDAPATTRTDGEESIGNFFPFNSAAEVFNGISEDGTLTSTVSQSYNTMNHHLGMTVDVDFRQPVGGRIGSGSSARPMTFGFSGDDDVWVFIDDVLVLDLGGIHSELYGTINFQTGDVYIGRAFGVNGVPEHPEDPNTMVTHTTLRALYEEALEAGDPALDPERWNGQTFASNTSHSLRMFYLERGNYDSSIALRFNLQPLLPQRIVKVDQDGHPLEDVEFALYPAEVTSQSTGAIPCLYTDTDEGNRQPFYVKETATADGKPLVTLTTGEDGSAEFITSTDAARAENTYFNFADRGNAYYVLKETKAPTGYRVQPVDIVLHYDPDSSMLSVANRWTTGAYACSVSNVTGPTRLRYGRWNAGGTIEPTSDVVGPADHAGGLVVAVPLLQKKSDKTWMALYGSNLGKFTAEAAGSTEDSWKHAVLLATLEQASRSNTDTAPWHLNWDSENRRLYGQLFDLPGLASRYRPDSSSGDMQMVYGLISADALASLGVTGDTAEARYASLCAKLRTPEAVQQALETLSSGFRFLNVDQFSRTFRSLIYIPNERRELQVQKVDQDGNPVAGAKFTLYKDPACTKEAASGTTDSDGLLVFSPSGNSSTPGQAHMEWARDEADPAVVVSFYLRETSAPNGYTVNDTVIPVQLGIYGIYADAGTKEDGVSVMAGVGKLTQTMRQYANGGDVDITLQDITAVMQTQESGQFLIEGWGDDKLEGTSVLRTMNLHFGLNAVVDYGLHDQDGGKVFKPFFVTDTGYIRSRVMQNYDALTGKLYENPNKDANMENLGSLDLTNLFSLLNMVVVTDQKPNAPDTGKLTIRKKVTNTTAQEDFSKNFTFTVELKKPDGSQLEGSYKYYFYGEDKAGDLEAGDKLLLHHDESVTILGLPVGTQVTVTEEDPGTGWHVSPSPAVYTAAIEKDGNFQAEFTNSRTAVSTPPPPPVIVIPTPSPSPSPSPSPAPSPSPDPDASPSPSTSPDPNASPGPSVSPSPQPSATATPKPTHRPGTTPDPDDELGDPDVPTRPAEPDGDPTPTPDPDDELGDPDVPTRPAEPDDDPTATPTPTPKPSASPTPKPPTTPPSTGGGFGPWPLLSLLSGLGLACMYRKRT